MKDVSLELKATLDRAKPIEITWSRPETQKPLQVVMSGTVRWRPGAGDQVEIVREGEPYTYEVMGMLRAEDTVTVKLAPVEERAAALRELGLKHGTEYVEEQSGNLKKLVVTNSAHVGPEHPATVAAERALRRICQAQADRAERLYQDAVMQAIRDVARGG